MAGFRRGINVGSVFEAEAGEFCVLVNAEGQHSLWPVFRDVPKGWTQTGPRGARKVCLDWIDTHWTDLRPKSVREVSST